MEDVPLKMPILQGVRGDFRVNVPDYFTILQETEYEFSLENWVLTGLQNGFVSQCQPQLSSSSSGLLPSCPPYWMMFSSPQQRCLASCHSSDSLKPNPPQCSYHLNAAVLHTMFTVSGSENKGGRATQKAHTAMSPTGRSSPECLTVSHQCVQHEAFVPNHLNPPACLSSLPHQCRKNLQHFSVLQTSTQHDVTAHSQGHNVSSHRHSGTLTPTTRANTIHRLHSTTNQQTKCMMSLSPDSWAPSEISTHAFSGSDSSAELLSALSPEERELLGSITARGYPLHTAIITLQKMGQQTSDQILHYLVACDHLCQLGYDMAEVEEALEMFQNCETKAEEFLHLLTQFHEMGFQQSIIKEVLLIHENHRERALEELMMRMALHTADQ